MLLFDCSCTNRTCCHSLQGDVDVVSLGVISAVYQTKTAQQFEFHRQILELVYPWKVMKQTTERL